MRVTRKMVAERAGVSKESVSYVLNRSRPVSDEIVKKVNQAVQELGYVPDVMARALNNKRSMSIGIVCNDLSNPYYSEILSGIYEDAGKYGFSVLIADAASRAVKQSIEDMVARRVDGICFLVFPDKFNYDYSVVTNHRIKIVVTHNESFNDNAIGHLEPDFKNGITDALSYLKEMGHSDIVMLSAFDESVTYDLRYFYFQEAYTKLFGREPRIYALHKDFSSSLESGKFLAEQFWKAKDPATAIICTNDLMAIGAMQFFEDHKITIPEDISVIGIDDLIFSSFVTPHLTSIGYDKKQFGKNLMEMLMQNIEKNEASINTFKMKLVVRDSVIPPPPPA